jgi:hypothetical protein
MRRPCLVHAMDVAWNVSIFRDSPVPVSRLTVQLLPTSRIYPSFQVIPVLAPQPISAPKAQDPSGSLSAVDSSRLLTCHLSPHSAKRNDTKTSGPRMKIQGRAFRSTALASSYNASTLTLTANPVRSFHMAILNLILPFLKVSAFPIYAYVLVRVRAS